MEDVLERAEKTLDTADRKLRLMEAKLATVTIEEKCTEAVQFTPTTSDGSAIEQTKTAATTTSPLPIIPRVSEENTELVESAPAILIKDDPEYNKYFKMLKMVCTPLLLFVHLIFVFIGCPGSRCDSKNGIRRH